MPTSGSGTISAMDATRSKPPTTTRVARNDTGRVRTRLRYACTRSSAARRVVAALSRLPECTNVPVCGVVEVDLACSLRELIGVHVEGVGLQMRLPKDLVGNPYVRSLRGIRRCRRCGVCAFIVGYIRECESAIDDHGSYDLAVQTAFD